MYLRAKSIFGGRSFVFAVDLLLRAHREIPGNFYGFAYVSLHVHSAVEIHSVRARTDIDLLKFLSMIKEMQFYHRAVLVYGQIEISRCNLNPS